MYQISIFVLLEFEVGLKSTTKAEAELGFYPEGPEIKYIYNSVKKKSFICITHVRTTHGGLRDKQHAKSAV